MQLRHMLPPRPIANFNLTRSRPEQRVLPWDIALMRGTRWVPLLLRGVNKVSKTHMATGGIGGRRQPALLDGEWAGDI